MIKEFLSNMFQPEASLKLIPIVNWTVVALLIMMAWSAQYTDIESYHISIMCFLSLGLLFSLNFFYIEFQKQKALQKDSLQNDDDVAWKDVDSPGKSRHQKVEQKKMR